MNPLRWNIRKAAWFVLACAAGAVVSIAFLWFISPMRYLAVSWDAYFSVLMIWIEAGHYWRFSIFGAAMGGLLFYVSTIELRG